MSLLITSVGPAPAAALESAQRQGFTSPVELLWPGGQALWFPTPDNPRGSGACVSQGLQFAAYTGTVHWKGLTGAPLLSLLLAEFRRPQDMPLHDFSGGFAMLFCREQEVWLFNDAVGLQKIYTSADGALCSTSFLVCRSLLKRPTVDRMRAQEYVLLGSNHARQTPVQGITTLDPAQVLNLCTRQASLLHAPAGWRIQAQPTSFQSGVDQVAGIVASDFKQMVQAFGPKVGMALSGGFDSRLLLAALDHTGVVPTLYVYGRPELDDVQIATAKAAALGLPITCIDKGKDDAVLAPLGRQRLKESIAFFDGLPVDGVFDRGTDRATRLHQVREGTLNLNGGGGEVLRNFFYLPDHRYNANDLVGAFYSNWLPRVIPDVGERRNFAQATADGILVELGLPAGTPAARSKLLPRSDVELVYTLFRLRWWMARNNTLAARYGAFLTPLTHPRLVQAAAQVPLAWKTYGALEAAIIQALSPRVAAGPSNYGFDFSQGPNRSHRRTVNATLYRPIAIRRRSPVIRQLLGRMKPATMPAEWLDAFSPPTADWIDATALTDGMQLNRLMTLLAVLDDELCGVA